MERKLIGVLLIALSMLVLMTSLRMQSDSRAFFPSNDEVTLYVTEHSIFIWIFGALIFLLGYTYVYQQPRRRGY